MIQYRPYTPTDKENCLKIFRSNTPKYFGAQEEAEFADFLDRMPCPYYMLEVDRQAIGCGGFFVNEEKHTAGLCWGMVHLDFHKQGYGKYLLLKRLDEICHSPQIERILLDTSQHSKGFFEKLGFIVFEIIEDGYFTGLHRHEMELKLDDEKRSTIYDALVRFEQQLEK